MSDKEKVKPGPAVFAVVDRPGEIPYRQEVITLQKKKRMVGGDTMPEESDSLTPDGRGLYHIGTPEGPYYDARMKALLAKMKRENIKGAPPRILGPFFDDDPDDIVEGKGRSAIENALIAVSKARPRTKEEQVKEAEATINRERQAFDQERNELKKEIEELKKEQAKREAGSKK